MRNNGRWRKGQSGNPKGRPKGACSVWRRFMTAVERVEAAKRVDLFEVFIRMALKHPPVMVALMNKLLPNKTANVLTVTDVQGLVSQIAAIVTSEVKDPVALNRISARIEQAVNADAA